MNTLDQKPLSTHTAERTLYQVQVRRRQNTSPNTLLNDRFVDTEWKPAVLPTIYVPSEHTDTVAELAEGLLPYALAMAEAWSILGVRHAHVFEVRLVPHVVKTHYASYPQEPLPELNREPA